MRQIQIKPNVNSYKIGMDEVVGLDKAMAEAFLPIIKELKSRIYWNNSILDRAEYKRRDGFIPHSHNCGGLMISQVIPKCEEYNFSFLEFGECDSEECAKTHDTDGCVVDDEGHLDSYLRIWFKFEGIEDGALKFYLVMSGSNKDAPYFREAHQPTLFEASFECKSVAGLKRAASKHIKALLKAMA